MIDERREIFLVRGNGFGFLGGQTLSPISGNSAIDDRATIETFPRIEYEKEV